MTSMMFGARASKKFVCVKPLSSLRKANFEVDRELLPSRRGSWLLVRGTRLRGRVQSVDLLCESHVEELTLREARILATPSEEERARRSAEAMHIPDVAAHLTPLPHIRPTLHPHRPHCHPSPPLQPTAIFSSTNESLQPHTWHLTLVHLHLAQSPWTSEYPSPLGPRCSNIFHSVLQPRIHTWVCQ